MKSHPRQTASPVQTGFTLVEVLVASAILAIGLLATATMVARSTIQDARAYYTTRASLMVEEFLENATRLQYNANDYRNMAGAAWNTTVDGVAYNTVCILANNTPMDNCKEMTCTITWNNKGLQARTQYVYVYAIKY